VQRLHQHADADEGRHLHQVPADRPLSQVLHCPALRAPPDPGARQFSVAPPRKRLPLIAPGTTMFVEIVMSRAFVRESDQEAAGEALPERIVSPHPNFVTPQGLKQIDEHIRQLEAERQAARSDADKSNLARIARDLRYWSQRRATARVIE